MNKSHNAKLSMRDRDVRLANLKLIEAEICNYHKTLQDMKDIEAVIAFPATEEQPGVQLGHSDPTPKRAIKMMTSTELLEIRKRVEAISYMLKILKAHPERGRYELIRLAYWDRQYTVTDICDRLNISERTYYRWRRDSLKIVAVKLGWDI